MSDGTDLKLGLGAWRLSWRYKWRRWGKDASSAIAFGPLSFCLFSRVVDRYNARGLCSYARVIMLEIGKGSDYGGGQRDGESYYSIDVV